jgi:hypothetical protein
MAVFERRHEPLVPFAAFVRRIVQSVSLAMFIIAIALGIGILGYRLLEDLPWVDAILNASMILGGMGPVNELHTTAAKLFASAYALFSGLIFVVVTGIVIAPILHRFFHWFHLEGNKKH